MVAASVVLIVIGGGAIGNIALGKGWAGDAFTPAAASTPSTKPTPPVPDTALTGLLLSADEIAPATGWPAGRSVLPGRVLGVLDVNLENDPCHSPVRVASSDDYLGTAYKALQGQLTIGPPTANADRRDWAFTNSVASFPTAAVAADMVEKAKKSWQQCANQTIKLHQPGGDGTGYQFTWATGFPAVDDRVLFMPMTRIGGIERWGCWRALGVRNNIVIDIAACTVGATKAAAQGAYAAIAAKVDAAV